MATGTVVGIDIGGTKIAGALVDYSGQVLNRSSQPTPAWSPDAILATAGQLVTDVSDGHGPAAVGVGTGGVVDSVHGVILSATNLLTDWTGTDLAAGLSSRVNLPVHVDNDANALAAGEVYFGDMTGTGLYVAVGTGIGGALVIDGALSHGPHHTAGGIGHMMSPIPTARRCSCGRPDHLEALASGPAIAARYRQQSGSIEDLTLEDVAARAAAGDRRAVQTIGTAARGLGQTIGGAANLVDPNIIVVGGGVTAIGPAFWDPLRSGIRSELLPPLSEVLIAAPRCDRDASVVGAAAVAFLRLG